ncbi:hypothetical protein FG385_05245 [Amycolatopsis alkalitolerans]|uniref:Uncharacterized protein n=1 Tax=Amycolatopsis alkalitolerans TaxID=2547244 RepID=A0A5C4MA43_9PSEU|nr:hypothetical protein FG385_05245 [Amycolatopsis alkalitolerans]
MERARPAEPAPPQLDPEQLRQFQQFQQFQDYLRFTEAQKQNGQLVHTEPGGPPVPPPPQGGLVQAPEPPRRPPIRMPRFAKRILASVLSALIFLAVLGIAGKLLYDHFFPAQDDNKPASETGGGTYHANKILSAQPYEAVRKVYQEIAIGRPDLACGQLDSPTQDKFARDVGAADCQQAVLDLKTKVTNVNDYAESISPQQYDPTATTITINSCDFSITGGPALGVFTVEKQPLNQWLITGHAPGPRNCTPPTPTS